MACSKPTPDDLESDENSLIICSICLDEMKSPKALPCLHSFCLACLKKVGHPPGRFICPLCKEEIPLPSDGVDGFRDNFFINQLKERKAISNIGETTMPCASCGAIDRQAAARCMDCNGFLCQQCVHLHETIAPLKVHIVFTIDELRSGEVDISKVMKEESCETHRDQVLRWFCKTCGIPICRDCTMMEHRHPEHDYDTIENVTKGQLAEIQKLMTNCRGISNKIDEAMKNTQQAKDNLSKSADEARRQLNEEKKRYLEGVEKNYRAKLDELTEIQTKEKEKIDNGTKSLQHLQSKLNNAMKIADQVINTGSKHDIVSNYSNLTKTLTQLQDVQPTGVSKSLGEVRFRPCQKGGVSVNLGTISSKSSPKERNGKWVLEKEIGKDGPGKIQHGFGVVVHPNTSDIYIAGFTSKNIKIFDSQGKYKQVLQGNLQTPHDVAISSNGFHYITDRSAYVKVFNPDGTYLKQFPAISPDGKSSDTDGSQLYGITIDRDGNLIVGSDKNYISKHNQKGTHIHSSKLDIRPFFITTTTQGNIAVCADAAVSSNSMHILDHTGKQLHIVHKPKDVKKWRPCGICCSDDGVFYVTSYSGGRAQTGIYSFTEDGEYLGCVTTDVTYAQGIALIDKDRLVVVQYGNPGKIFSYVEQKE